LTKIADFTSTDNDNNSRGYDNDDDEFIAKLGPKADATCKKKHFFVIFFNFQFYHNLESV